MAGSNVVYPYQQPPQHGVGYASVEKKVIKLETTGYQVYMRDEVHVHTNHLIRSSRSYFPDVNLRTYWMCPKLNYIAAVAWFLAVILGFFCSAFGLSMNFVLLVLFLPIYVQHEIVNQKTIPIVLTQPIIQGQRFLNDFYELSIDELSGVSLELYHSGTGFLAVGSSHRSIKYMGLNVNAVREIHKARLISRLLLFAFAAELLCAIVYLPIICS